MDANDLLLTGIANGSFIALARALTIVENDLKGSEDLLEKMNICSAVPIIGITGPPGAGKSTLVNSVIGKFSDAGKRTAVLAIDPTSPFNFGSLLGDRIRMSAHFNNANVFIRSVAARGSVGGLSAKIIEMTDVLRSADFDYIIVETVGVGQSEIEIAGLADITFVVLIPGSGDEIQHIKSGLMEIGNAFIVNKGDGAGADIFTGQLKKMLDQRIQKVPVFKTIANKGEGIDAVVQWINNGDVQINERKLLLYTEKAFRLMQNYRMRDISKNALQQNIAEVYKEEDFNMYRFVARYLKNCSYDRL